MPRIHPRHLTIRTALEQQPMLPSVERQLNYLRAVNDYVNDCVDHKQTNPQLARIREIAGLQLSPADWAVVKTMLTSQGNCVVCRTRAPVFQKEGKDLVILPTCDSVECQHQLALLSQRI